MSDSVRPHRRKPTRLPRPWDSPGKNTGVGCHFLLQCMKVKIQSKVVQSCLTLSDPMDCSPPGSSVHEDTPSKKTSYPTLNLCLYLLYFVMFIQKKCWWKYNNLGPWLMFTFKSLKVKVKSLSHVRLFVTPWTAAYQAPPSMGFSRQEYWSGVPFHSLEY